MKVFGDVRGCFMVINVPAGRPAQLKLPVSGPFPSNNYAEPIFVSGFSFTEAEQSGVVKCFGDVSYTYAFGHDPDRSNLTVNFTSMIMGGGVYQGRTSSGNPVDDMLRVYQRNRLSRSLKYAYFIAANQIPLRGFIVGMQSRTISPELGLVGFTVSISLPEAQ